MPLRPKASINSLPRRPLWPPCLAREEVRLRLTHFTDLALRLLLFMAAHPDQRTTIAQAAAAYGVSRSHLMKVAARLASAGLIRPGRGRGGGLALSRPPREITLGEVLRATEPDFAMVGCMAGEACTLTAVCRLPSALESALRAFLETADRYSILDVLPGHWPVAPPPQI